jgi:four helix bundle protein
MEDRIMDRRTANRAFTKLVVWNDAVHLYVLACQVFREFPFELKKVAANSIDAAHSISRNIAEGHCRGSLNEYLNFLNYSLGSCGELYSCYVSCHRAGQISDEQCEELDRLHYKVENTAVPGRIGGMGYWGIGTEGVT